ncbi:hypothetical protein Pcinc_035840 [Petrolisthes cinctipes]|uniref:RanBP2-type domain-containing protein n=1 Tax=Petrolisthes cinctipes TaxID=88211 RepID=A0AAE1BVP6_PETCI|nr:hypothetical protein Pcinc_035840 [Petrolisthes cinctipes]
MDSGRPQPESRHNIPHMQLFHHLKQKFPDLKDNDVNESIQKYGLDRERCEEELSQKTQLHHGGYYGPWGRSSSALSSPAMSRVTSPIRTTMPSPPTGVPSTPTTPVLTTTCPNSLPVHHHSTATHHVFGPLHSSGYLVYSYNPGIVGVGGPEPVYTSPTTVAAVATSPVFYQPPVSSGAVSYGWHPAVSNGVRASGVQSPPARHVQGGSGRQDSPFGSREASKSRSSTPVMPKSAPVVPNSFDPFSAYENKGPPERRKSEETHYNVRKNNHCNISEMEEEDFEIINHSPYHSLTPPPNTVDSPSTLTSTTTTLTTTTSSCTSPRTINGSSSGRPPAGRRHVSSIYLTPVPPHGAHHAPGPPSSDGTVSVCGRSYTSVNLQLRQPSTEPQPPIQIRSSGSSLTYSTSSLDHRHGSRSSLQISIGPTGGTISAMRTNLDNKNSQANTAFHIQYSSSANEGPSPTGVAFPTTGDVVGKEGVQGQARRPQSWCVSDSGNARERKSSLSECVGPPVSLHLLHYPPRTDTTLGYSAEEPMLAVPPSRPDSSHIQAVVIAEQRVRKERLEAEVTRQLKEKSQLESEVEMMMRELQAREHQRKLTADTNTMRIEDVQKENQRLQSECYEMENKILRLAPDLETEVGLTLTSPTSYREAPHPPHLPRASSGSSLGSGTAGTPQTPGTPQQHFPGSYIPTRPAPPPPVPSPALHNHTYHDYQGVDGNTADEASGHKWGCSKCTFINHPDMNKCEICDYPRFTIGFSGAAASATTTTHSSCSSLPLITNDKPSLTNILKEKLIGMRDRSDSV